MHFYYAFHPQTGFGIYTHEQPRLSKALKGSLGSQEPNPIPFQVDGLLDLKHPPWRQVILSVDHMCLWCRVPVSRGFKWKPNKSSRFPFGFGLRESSSLARSRGVLESNTSVCLRKLSSSAPRDLKGIHHWKHVYLFQNTYVSNWMKRKCL